MVTANIYELAEKIIQSYTSQDLQIVTAESCTGGLIAGCLTNVPGSSAVFERGFVSYSNESKTELLGVLPEVIEEYGAVSEEVAEAMAKGALEFSHADIAISVTGIAGPDGGTSMKPVGLVFFGVATREGVLFHSRCEFKGDRDNIRLQAVHEALTLLSTLAAGPA